MPPTIEVLSVKAAAAYLAQRGLKISARQLYHMGRQGTWPFFHVAGLRKLVIRREALDDILAGNDPRLRPEDIGK